MKLRRRRTWLLPRRHRLLRVTRRMRSAKPPRALLVGSVIFFAFFIAMGLLAHKVCFVYLQCVRERLTVVFFVVGCQITHKESSWRRRSAWTCTISFISPQPQCFYGHPESCPSSAVFDRTPDQSECMCDYDLALNFS